MIIPGILTDSLEAVQHQLDVLAELKPQPDSVQIDILDGEFADELTIETAALRELDRHNLTLDVHLMTVEPAYFLEELVGTSGVGAVIGQVERMSSQREFLESVRQNGWRAGLSLNLYTPLEAVEPEIWELVDILQVMGGAAGAQGQPFHQSALATIKEADQWRRELGLDYRIMVDIGQNPDTIPLSRAAGADDFIVGSFLNQETAKQWQALQRTNP